MQVVFLFDSEKIPSSVSFAATFSFESKRQVNMAFIAASFSNIKFINWSFSILWWLQSISNLSCSASALSSEAKRTLFNAIQARKESTPTSFSGGMTPVTIPLSDSILQYELLTSWFPAWETSALRSHALSQLDNSRKPHPRPLDPVGHFIQKRPVGGGYWCNLRVSFANFTLQENENHLIWMHIAKEILILLFG